MPCCKCIYKKINSLRWEYKISYETEQIIYKIINCFISYANEGVCIDL